MTARRMRAEQIPDYLDKHGAMPGLNRDPLIRMLRTKKDFNTAISYMNNQPRVIITKEDELVYLVVIDGKDKPENTNHCKSIW